MMARKRMAQLLREGNGTRALLVLIYGVMTYRFYTSGSDCRIFIGMFRIPDAVGSFGLTDNMYAFGFLLFGVLLPLEQPSKYLSIPETMVYVRRRRGLPRFIAYCGMVMAFCLVCTGVQLLVAAWIVRASYGSLTTGAICAGWTLMVLLLAANLGYLGGNRAYGYLAALLMVIVPLSYAPAMRWLVEAPLFLPNWSLLLAASTVVLTAANYALFERLEII